MASGTERNRGTEKENQRGSASRRRRLINGYRNPPSPVRPCYVEEGCITNRDAESRKRQRKGKGRIEMTADGGLPWYKTNEKKTNKTSSLKLKEAKIGILLPKLSVMPPRAVSNVKPIAFWLMPPLPPFGTDKFVDVYTEITKATSVGERSKIAAKEAARSTVANSISLVSASILSRVKTRRALHCFGFYGYSLLIDCIEMMWTVVEGKEVDLGYRIWDSMLCF